LIKRALRRDFHYYLLLLLPLAYFIIFHYVPMYGLSLAFRRFIPGGPAYGTEWVGSKYFELFVDNIAFWKVFRNTVLLSMLSLVFTFPLPIIFAILLNELRSVAFKRVVQTISYLPRFLSTVIVVGMISQILSPSGGIVNNVLERMGAERIFFLIRPEWFRTIFVTSEAWQFMGWNAIIYLAALSNVNPELYQAASVDGAGRLRQTFAVTIPGIMPTIVILLILRIGNLLTVGFEKVLLLYNPLTYETADVISTFVYRMGIVENNYSYATAVGLFNGIIALILIWIANAISRRVSETSLW
jgi:putative aldouronate transport system permease protein